MADSLKYTTTKLLSHEVILHRYRDKTQTYVRNSLQFAECFLEKSTGFLHFLYQPHSLDLSWGDPWNQLGVAFCYTCKFAVHETFFFFANNKSLNV